MGLVGLGRVVLSTLTVDSSAFLAAESLQPTPDQDSAPRLPSMRVCIVDLNNFASYPTISVGLLVAILRKAGIDVDVFSPLSLGVQGVKREARVPAYGLLLERIGYRTAVSKSRLVSSVRQQVARRRRSGLVRQSDDVACALEHHLQQHRPDAVLISTYLMYLPLCKTIAGICQSREIPVLIGGQYFVHSHVLDEWTKIDGVSGIVGGEVEHNLPDIVRDLVEGRSLGQYAGVYTADDAAYQPAPPLQDLDSVPFADYRDFDWDKYATPIVPMITGRGCAWGACTFCSDVTSAAGRTFRSRSLDNVLAEIELQSTRHDTGHFVFTDLKLNSHRAVWEGLIANIRRFRDDVRWIGALHIGNTDRDHDLPEQLAAASQAGMVRMTTGLETGSQRLADTMHKGTDLTHTSKCLNAANDAGISTRVTLIVGYPSETADDVHATAEYLKRHEHCIERARLNRFQIIMGTKFHRELMDPRRDFSSITNLTENRPEALVNHRYQMACRRDYRRAIDQLLGVVHQINRRPLRATAKGFDGVM